MIIFQSPHNTPNYALYLEKGLNKVLIHTLDVNINSILRVLSLPPNRLPNILARLIYKKNIFGEKSSKLLGRKHGWIGGGPGAADCIVDGGAGGEQAQACAGSEGCPPPLYLELKFYKC